MRVFTHKQYQKFPNALIIVGDCSWGMLKKAKYRFDREGITNAIFLRLDIGHLPIKDNTVDYNEKYKTFRFIVQASARKTQCFSFGI